MATLRVFLKASAYVSEGRNVATFARIVAQVCHPVLVNVFMPVRQSKLEEMYGKTKNRAEFVVSEQRIPRAGAQSVVGQGFPI